MYEAYISLVLKDNNDIRGEFIVDIKAKSLEEASEYVHKNFSYLISNVWKMEGFEITNETGHIVYSHTEK